MGKVLKERKRKLKGDFYEIIMNKWCSTRNEAIVQQVTLFLFQKCLIYLENTNKMLFSVSVRNRIPGTILTGKTLQRSIINM